MKKENFKVIKDLIDIIEEETCKDIEIIPRTAIAPHQIAEPFSVNAIDIHDMDGDEKFLAVNIESIIDTDIEPFSVTEIKSFNAIKNDIELSSYNRKSLIYNLSIAISEMKEWFDASTETYKYTKRIETDWCEIFCCPTKIINLPQYFSNITFMPGFIDISIMKDHAPSVAELSLELLIIEQKDEIKQLIPGHETEVKDND